MNDNIRAILTKNGIKQPSSELIITDARWMASQNDWWVCIDDEWYWWDRRTTTWKLSQYGPK